MIDAKHRLENFEGLGQYPSLQKGERPIDHAPQIILPNGCACIPQHYLVYEHNRDTIEAILDDIDYDPHYLLFVSEDQTVPYIQVGIVGYDNYKPIDNQPGQKIVFGRKWRVEPNLPTSEIIQTAFLALKKAKEHEIRECFKVKWRGSTTTPFNSHQDLPLLAHHQALIEDHPSEQVTLSEILTRVTYKGTSFSLESQQYCQNGKWLFDLSHADFTAPLSLLLSDLEIDTVLYSLMDALIAASDRQVDETFTYKGFARFSRKNSVKALSDISVRTRAKITSKQSKSEFHETFAQEQYETDASRVPELTNSPYSNTLRNRLATLQVKTGFIPE